MPERGLGIALFGYGVHVLAAHRAAAGERQCRDGLFERWVAQHRVQPVGAAGRGEFAHGRLRCVGIHGGVSFVVVRGRVVARGRGASREGIEVGVPADLSQEVKQLSAR